MAPRQLIVCGWPTAAVHHIAFVLNEHPQVIVGFERYGRVRSQVDAYHFAPERLLDPLPQETYVRGELLYQRLRERHARQSPEYVGDAAAGYVPSVAELAERMRSARVVVVLGVPPVGDEGRLRAWSDAAGVTRDGESGPHFHRFHLIAWDQWLERDERSLDALLRFLELPECANAQAERFRLLESVTAEPARAELSSEDAIGELEAWRRARAATELESSGASDPARSDPGGGQTGPLTADELLGRDLERSQLRDQLRLRAADWPDELEILQRRRADDAVELERRGRALRARALSSAVGLPDKGLRVTILNPFRRSAVIERAVVDHLASHLAGLLSVRLAVQGQHPVPRAVSDSIVCQRFDDPRLLADSDVVLCPAVSPAFEEVSGTLDVGTRLILLLSDQAGLELATAASDHDVIAMSGWLARAARAAGLRAFCAPPGLHHELLAPGAPIRKRADSVSALAGSGEHDGSPELEEALVRVREARPDMEVTVIGGVPVDGCTSYLPAPSITWTMGLLRSSAVHIVASHADTCGTLGAMALAAGSALVTTDTPGAGEHVIDGRTAVVVPVGDPDAMAAGVLALLEDAELRTRMAVAGQRYVTELFPSWREAARRVALIIQASR